MDIMFRDEQEAVTVKYRSRTITMQDGQMKLTVFGKVVHYQRKLI